MERRLFRSEQDRMIAGVCGGLAVHFDVDPTLVRIAFVLLALFHGLGLILYVVMALLTPRESAVGHSPDHVFRTNAGEYAGAARSAASGVREAFAGAHQTPPPPPHDGVENAHAQAVAGAEASEPREHAAAPAGVPVPQAATAEATTPRRGGLLVGAVLIGLGALLLARNLGWFWIDWGTYWPVILIAIGLALIVHRR